MEKTFDNKYVDSNETERAKVEKLGQEEIEIAVDKYGLAKPKRKVIKAKLINGKS